MHLVLTVDKYLFIRNHSINVYLQKQCVFLFIDFFKYNNVPGNILFF